MWDIPFAAGTTTIDLKSAADSLLPIVQSQRERFRMRAQELEAVSYQKKSHFISQVSKHFEFCTEHDSDTAILC